MRVAFCWTQFSGYMGACWRALLKEVPGLELLVIGRSGSTQERAEAPYSSDIMAGVPHRAVSENEMADERLVASIVADARPDVVVLPGWGIPAYRKLTRPRFPAARLVMTMDTSYHGRLRQKLAPFVVGRYVRQMDAVVVPGERAWQYARYLGVSENRIHRGLYGYDDEPLKAVYTNRALSEPNGWPRRFLYMARYHPDKAIDVLVDGYRRYRTLVSEPWPLDCAGTGPLRDLVRGEGINDLGFIQPHEQSQVWASHAAFVLPSRYEPWGVAIAEAAATGLPIVCTEACGASVELVRNLCNGITIPTDNPQALASALQWIHQNHDACAAMGAAGRQLALPFRSYYWARRWRRLLEQVTPNHLNT